MMLKLTEVAAPECASDDVLILPWESRQKSRLQAVTTHGRKVGLFLNRGQILRSGTVLTGSDAITVRIQAAPEQLSVIRSDNALQFARACYHLGNRHVPLQILAGELHYLHDHVLDHMLMGLGFTVTHELLPFEPEAGAYHGHAH